jgi:asparagine synthase (glutamine-hydrolysing)
LRAELNGYSPTEHLEKHLPANFNSWNYLEKSQWLETTIFMSGYLLSSQGDRMAMANSVEGRYPFLDYRVIEFCNKLPDSYKLNGLNEKFFLKKLMADKIPDSILRRSKQAYRAPVRSTFFLENPPDYIDEMLSQEYFDKAGIFDYPSVSALRQKIVKTGNASEVEDMVFASVISTHLLHKMFIEKDNADFLSTRLSNLKLIDDTNNNL